MRVAIFGANGTTGCLLTEDALKEGHQVTVLIRNPDGFKYREKVRVVPGSVFELQRVKETLHGAEAVFSALGAHSPLRNENVLPRAVPVIVQAMQEMGIRRIIALGSAGARSDSLKKQPRWRRWFVENMVYTLLLKWPVQEQRVQYELLSNSGLDWTMVMPPMLTNGVTTDSYRIDGEALPTGANHISRADVAHFMMRELVRHEWSQRGVYIGN